MSDFVDARTVYLHIPKTGGNWVREVLQRSGRARGKTHRHKHATYDLLCGAGLNRRRYALGNPFRRRRDFRYFCVVRNPLLWYQSWFHYQTGRRWRHWGEVGNTADWHCLSPLNRHASEDFNEFMKNVNRETPGFLTYLYYAYAEPSGARVLRNENLRDDLLALNSEWRLGLDERLIRDHEKINVSKKVPLAWTEENYRNTVRNEAGAFGRYGYDGRADGVIAVA